MAGFLRLYKTQPWSLTKEYTIGAAANVKGIVFDGFYFWIVDEDNLYQCWIDNDDNFRIIRTIASGTGIPGFLENSAICTDGYNLFIAYHTLTGSPATDNAGIAVYDKDGRLINVLTCAAAVSASWGTSEYLDVTHDGFYLYATYSIFANPVSFPHWIKIDVKADAIVADSIASVGRLAGAGVAFLGKDFILLVSGAGNQTFAAFDFDYNQLSDSAGTGLTTAQGITYCSNDPILASVLCNGFMDQFRGDWVGLVYN